MQMSAKGQTDVAAFYFPGWHVDARNEALEGQGFTEWELVKRAQPLYPGHYQPRVPSWGYFDESDPRWAEKQIAAAVDHGVDVFHVDWYWYGDRTFLEGALEQGLLQAGNIDRIRFGIMWANHAWINLFPLPLSGKREIRFPTEYGDETMDRMIEYCIRRYFRHPAYWKIEGKPVFSVFDLDDMMRKLGAGGAKRLFGRFQERMKAHGLPELHLNIVQYYDQANGKLSELGISSATNYQTIWDPTYGEHMVDPKCVDDKRAAKIQDYGKSVCNAQKHWQWMSERIDVPYYPVITQGWDSSPRGEHPGERDISGYPWYPVVENNTPEHFETEAAAAKQFAEAVPVSAKVVFINSWNEWTEGSYLLPDERYGMAYLEALRRVFGGSADEQA